MQITCPKCGYAGNIADKLVPDEGRNVSCPRCKTAIFVKKEATPPPPAPEPEPRAIPVREVRSYLGSDDRPNPPRTYGPAATRGSLIVVGQQLQYRLTKLAAIVAAGICVVTGIYLADNQPASGENNVLFTICNGMGYYFIAKGIFIGVGLWTLAKIREAQEKGS